jgi:hypothetical protein
MTEADRCPECGKGPITEFNAVGHDFTTGPSEPMSETVTRDVLGQCPDCLTWFTRGPNGDWAKT